MTDKKTPRWEQRFDNYKRALALLQEAMDINFDDMSDLEKEGTIQRFEFTFELAWKTMKDFLLFSGIQLDIISPKNIIKESFAANIIKEGQLWIDMLEARNMLSHAYDQEVFENTLKAISKDYLSLLHGFKQFLDNKEEGK